ncbi:hypothetical protein [Sanguibacteroides sp. AM78-02pH3A]|uniref:hypothetical protein n=1 Tax=Sanguibacteroides sp. AM78-02pH3A TaxID=3002646 RepID=UPI0022E91752|nr:hypothetical protein [Sanguibacteroides sp. AM78-02pH3A]
MKNIGFVGFVIFLGMLLSCSKGEDSPYNSKNVEYAVGLSEDTIVLGQSVTVLAEINQPLSMSVYVEKKDKIQTYIGKIESPKGSLEWTPKREEVDWGENYIVVRVYYSSSHSISKYTPIYIKESVDGD